MCGLIGYVGWRDAPDILLAGLRRLEYRGYDSAGICVQGPSALLTTRAIGSLENLDNTLGGNPAISTTGIGHTRWATHGRVCVENAHPLSGCREGEFSLVLNGIIENYRELRSELIASGHQFRSDTDAEAVAHLVEEQYSGNLADAVRKASEKLEGHFALLAMHRDHPQYLVATRRECPLVVGLGEGETYCASMIAAFIADTRQVNLIEDGDIVELTQAGAQFFVDGQVVERELVDVDWDDETAQKQGCETFMLKEIYEQPLAAARTLAGRVRGSRPTLEELELDSDFVRDLSRVVIVACGTAYHAGLLGRLALEGWARVSCEADIASEWRYRDPILAANTLVVGISQSGETADTLAAVRLARSRGARTLAVTNMPGSQITREADSVVYTRAGLEMGVAATKTFTAQAAMLFLLALRFAELRATLDKEGIEVRLEELRTLPDKIERFLAGDHPINEIALRHFEKPFFFYLGRHIGLPVALEGALKLKEISYIPTEAYSAGEMKHGPIALLDASTPVVCIATDSHVYDKVVSNIQEVRARGAQVIAIATDGNEDIQHLADDVIYVPRSDPYLQGILAVLPLQLLAYRIARLRGLDVDRPRNLAKTVTVE